MTRLVPDFRATFVPGASTVSFAERVIPVTFSPSTARVPAFAAGLRLAARRQFFHRWPILRRARARCRVVGSRRRPVAAECRVPGSEGNGRAGVRAHLA
ncbi:MAG: hypothetical protein F4213_13690 [Boseongicola sp. SB0677_bin_26]|nr:hypothetical protein [Boseongicola sp. SB0665_bin_10]MYG27054.1 hypothetical protein [Boseongicola sp. SB0677_bin_26]